MKERILNGWTFTRVFYLLLGSMVIIQSAMSHQWFGVFFGAYFASMGLFAFGCAAGNCFGGQCLGDDTKKADKSFQDVKYEEIK